MTAWGRSFAPGSPPFRWRRTKDKIGFRLPLRVRYGEQREKVCGAASVSGMTSVNVDCSERARFPTKPRTGQEVVGQEGFQSPFRIALKERLPRP